MYGSIKLNAQQPDYSYYSKKIKIHFLFDFIFIISLYYHVITLKTHFPYRTLGMAQVEGTIFIMFIYPVIFQDFVLALFLLLF